MLALDNIYKLFSLASQSLHFAAHRLFGRARDLIKSCVAADADRQREKKNIQRHSRKARNFKEKSIERRLYTSLTWESIEKIEKFDSLSRQF